jgi:hypothetical protein
MSNQKEPLTLERLKGTVSHVRDKILKDSLCGIIECAYQIALINDKTEEEAVKIAAFKLQKTLLNIKLSNN